MWRRMWLALILMTWMNSNKWGHDYVYGGGGCTVLCTTRSSGWEIHLAKVTDGIAIIVIFPPTTNK